MSDELHCVVCGRGRQRSECEVLKLSVEEKMAIRSMGQKPLDEVVYCRPCHRLMADPTRAADLLAGMILMRLRAAGVKNADQLAAKFKSEIAARSTKLKS